MIKLAALALVPALAATFYVQPEMPGARVAEGPTAAESQDRAFLASLDVEKHAAPPAHRTDREFLARLQAEEIPVMKAIAIERPAVVAPVATHMESAEAAMPEVRRAIPVAAPRTDLRAKFSESYITMTEPEVRRTSAAHGGRASIVILGDQVTITPGSSGNVNGAPQIRQ